MRAFKEAAQKLHGAVLCLAAGDHRLVDEGPAVLYVRYVALLLKNAKRGQDR
jgi:hypothetical protein